MLKCEQPPPLTIMEKIGNQPGRLCQWRLLQGHWTRSNGACWSSTRGHPSASVGTDRVRSSKGTGSTAAGKTQRPLCDLQGNTEILRTFWLPKLISSPKVLAEAGSCHIPCLGTAFSTSIQARLAPMTISARSMTVPKHTKRRRTHREHGQKGP